MNHNESLKMHQSFDDEFDTQGIPRWLSAAIVAYEVSQKYTKADLLRIGHAILNHIDVQDGNVVVLKEDGTGATEAERIDVYFAVVSKAIESTINEKNENASPTNANSQKLTTEVAIDDPMDLHKKLDMEIAMTGTIPRWLAQMIAAILMEDVNPETVTFEELVAVSNEFSLHESALIGHAILDHVVEDSNDPGVVKFRDVNGEIVGLGTDEVNDSSALRMVALEAAKKVKEDRNQKSNKSA